MWCVALLSLGVLTGVATPALLRRLPEPADIPGNEEKTPYRTLAHRRFGLAVGACSLAAALVVIARTDPPLWVVWAPLTTLGVLLGCIDAVTTWLPLAVTRLLWVATAVAAIGLGLLLMISPAAPWQAVLLRMLLGAIAVGSLFWAFWWLAGGLGFGDVRLAPVLGAVTAAHSWQTLVAGLVLGTVTGALHGIGRRLQGRPGPFPYGPSLLIGAFAALLWSG